MDLLLVNISPALNIEFIDSFLQVDVDVNILQPGQIMTLLSSYELNMSNLRI